MRRPNLTIVVTGLLACSLIVNGILIAQSITPRAADSRVDQALVGTWLSTSPRGHRLILLQSGQFVVTNYGTPYGPAGTWSTEDGRLKVSWAFDEDEEKPSSYETAYFLTEDGARLELKKDVFTAHAHLFTKSSGKQ